VKAGNFVGIERPMADIGGFKIEALEDSGFMIDDFSLGDSSTSSTIPEPGTLASLGYDLARRVRELLAS